MKNKQTAVEYIVNVVNSCIAPDYIPNEIVKQAKQMEKEQIKDAYVGNNDDEFGLLINIKDMAEQYYNETYGKDNE
jgi:DNA-directed RNA polymerase subunit E'/Rpb7